MKYSNFLCFRLAIILVVTLIVSCRKTDHQAIQAIEEPLQDSKFFTNHKPTDTLVKSVWGFVKRQNEKYKFANNLIKKIGYPYWDKAITMRRKTNITGRVFSDSTNTVFIPFVLDSQNIVNTTLVVNTSPSDTNFHFLADWQYQNRPYGSPSSDTTAENVALLFMILDKNVFGYNRFTITDSSLFRALPIKPNSTGREIRLITPTSGRVANQNRTAFVYTVTVCYNSYYCGSDVCKFDYNGICDYMNCPTGVCWLISSVCFEYEVDTDPSGGGGSGGGDTGGTGGGDSGGGGGGEDWEPPPCPEMPVARVAVIVECEPGWVPPVIIISVASPYVCNYQMTQHEIDVFNQIDAEDNAADQQSQNLDCKGTKMSGGNISFSGTKEHWLIQLDYIAKNPLSGEREFAIPNSGVSGGRGYADIANIANGNMFEIKPDNQSGKDAGILEVTNYVSKANTFCSSTLPPGTFWNKGTTYSTTYIPTAVPGQYLTASKIADGVIGYKYETPGNPVPVPITIPASVLDKLKYLIDRLKGNLANADRIIAEFLKQNPDLLTYIKGAAIGAGIAIIVGTILEDILTGGWGIADDWASFMLAKRIIRFGLAL